MVRYPIYLFLIIITLMIKCTDGNNDIIIVGELKKINYNTSPCGVFHFGSLSEYKVIKLIKGDYKFDKIYIVHGCIELPREIYKKRTGTLKKF